MGRGGAGRGREGLGGRKVEGEAVATSSLRTSGEGGDGTLRGGGGGPADGGVQGRWQLWERAGGVGAQGCEHGEGRKQGPRLGQAKGY